MDEPISHIPKKDQGNFLSINGLCLEKVFICLFFNFCVMIQIYLYCYPTTYTWKYPTVPHTYIRTDPETIEIGARQ